MRRSLMRWRVAVCLLAVLVAGLAGCGSDDGAVRRDGAPWGSASAGDIELLVLGAASLSDVLKDLAQAYEEAHPGTRITLATDGSDALRARIEEGLPGDAFVSADAANPARLEAAGLVLGAPVAVARNGLAIAVSPQRRDVIRTPLDLAEPGVRLVGAGLGVPITMYSERALDRLAGLPGYPADFALRVEGNVVSREDNVRAALAKVALGEGDAAFVYATDVAGRSDIGVVQLPGGAAVEAEHVAVVLAGAAQPQAAGDLVAWLRSPDAQAIFAARGFNPADR